MVGRGSMGNHRTGSIPKGRSMVGNRGMGNSCVSNRDRSEGTMGRLELRQTLGVVMLKGGGNGGAKSLRLDKAPDLLSWPGDGLVRGLACWPDCKGEGVAAEELRGTAGDSN